MSQACSVAQEGSLSGTFLDFVTKVHNNTISLEEVRCLFSDESLGDNLLDISERFLQKIKSDPVFATEVKLFLRGTHKARMRRSKHLRLIKGGKVVLPATDGTQTISKADDIFGWVCDDFVNWGLNKPTDSTPEILVEVHEIVKDGTFDDVFKGIGVDLDLLAMTPHQIKVFCKEHRDLLRKDGYGTFFLMKRKKDGTFFVAYVRFDDSGRLKVSVRGLARCGVWSAGHTHRFVLPQLGA